MRWSREATLRYRRQVRLAGGSRLATVALRTARPGRWGLALLVLATGSAARPASAAPSDFRQAGNRVVASQESGGGFFGNSVALSADGNTALVGGPYDNGGKGAAWVFTRTGANGWTQEQKLTPSDEVGAGEFGASVALSSDGATALIGARYDNGQGAAWVFTRSSQIGVANPWHQQGAKLTGVASDVGEPPSAVGWSVALSGDGTVALVGAPGTMRSVSGQGVVWQFNRSGNTWQRQIELHPLYYRPYAQFGKSVAISGDGLSALVGAPTGSSGQGVGRGFVSRFVRFGPTEPFQVTSQTAVPTPNITALIAFGSSVALSYDGTFSVIGAPDDLNGAGAVWAFSWPPPAPPAPAQYLGTLNPSGRIATNGAFGTSVAISGDGATFVAGAPRENGDRGAIWVYTRSQTMWDQQGGRIEAGGETGPGRLGMGVAIARDGHSALVGGPYDNAQVGAVWSFVDRAAVTSMNPTAGPTTGGNHVVIAGSKFSDAVRVAFGGQNALDFGVLSSTLIDAVVPPGDPGVVDVTVTTSAGVSFTSDATKYTYVPPSATPTSPPPSNTPTPSATASSTPTASPTASPTPSPTPSATPTSLPPSATPSPTATETAPPTATSTSLPTASPSQTPNPTASASPEVTAMPTRAPTSQPQSYVAYLPSARR